MRAPVNDAWQSGGPAGRHGVDAAILRAARALFPTGVTVLSCRDGDQLHAMTAGSLVWASLTPPLVGLSLRRGARTAALTLRAGAFAVSVLGTGQVAQARHFADPERPSGDAQFAAVDWWPAPVSQAPLLDGCLAWFDCLVEAASPAGDHDVVLGRVVWAADSPRRDPLLRFAHSYRSLSCASVDDLDSVDGGVHAEEDRRRNGHG